MDELALVQLPPDVPSNNVMVNVGHTGVFPVIEAGSGFTVTVATVIQPVTGTV